MKLLMKAHTSEGGVLRVVYRCRRYVLSYVEDEDVFLLTNKQDVIIARIVGETFQFYVSLAPEIGLNLVWGLLAQLNIYPVNSL